MVAAVAGKIDAGQLQLFTVDSVDTESWYNRAASPRNRVARHLQYEEYLIHEVVPLIRQKNSGSRPNSRAASSTPNALESVEAATRRRSPLRRLRMNCTGLAPSTF